MSIELTKTYIDYFNNKDIDGISSILHEQFYLEDPVVKRVEGKSNSLYTINNIFTSVKDIEFKAKNIFQDKNTTMIEFILVLDGAELAGVDIIEWEDEKMTALRAYLDIPKS